MSEFEEFKAGDILKSELEMIYLIKEVYSNESYSFRVPGKHFHIISFWKKYNTPYLVTENKFFHPSKKYWTKVG